MVCAAAPGQPSMVNAVERMPDSVVIRVTAPENIGGMPVIAYSVQYDGGTYDYTIADSGRLLPSRLQKNWSELRPALRTAILLLQLQTIMHRKRAVYSSNGKQRI